jgi:hypothetical protein
MYRFAQKDTIRMNLWDREQFLAAWEAHESTKKIPTRVISAATRDLVESNFGVSAHDQIRIEQYLDAKNDLSPIDIGELPNAPEEWREMWAKYVMPSQGDYPSFVSRIDYDNIGELLDVTTDDKAKGRPGKALLINRDPTADARLRTRPMWTA